jgi:uncharacterized integral membrane protein
MKVDCINLGGIFIKMNKLKWFLYFSAVLLILIPILIVAMSDVSFNSTFSNTVISIALISVILGKTITILQKRKENKSSASDIGAVIGLCII